MTVSFVTTLRQHNIPIQVYKCGSSHHISVTTSLSVCVRVYSVLYKYSTNTTPMGWGAWKGSMMRKARHGLAFRTVRAWTAACNQQQQRASCGRVISTTLLRGKTSKQAIPQSALFYSHWRVTNVLTCASVDSVSVWHNTTVHNKQPAVLQQAHKDNQTNKQCTTHCVRGNKQTRG